MKCIHFPEEECESSVVNTNQCNKCLVLRNAKLLKSFEERLIKLEKAKKPPVKKTGRVNKVSLTG